MSRLDRYKAAQNAADSGFESALAEIRSGRKTGHWIWYVLPQIGGMGFSSMSQFYAIDGEDEAVEYLQDAELRSRLLTMATAIAEQLRKHPQRSVAALMGSDTDARKLVSSLTLFGHVARTLASDDGPADYGTIADIADEVLRAASAHGYPRCAFTLEQLTRGG